MGSTAYYEYNDCDRVSKRTLGNGCLTYYEYDIKDRVVKIDHRTSDLTQLAELQYQYDKVGNPTKIAREDGSATYYRYDKVKRLVAETQVDGLGQVEYAFEYQYDGAHNRTLKVENGTPTYYTYNAANQMLTEVTGAETIYYQYDGCGNTVARQAPAGTTYYAYDTENLMTRVDFADGSHCYYTYDADSKRVSQRTPEGYTEFIYQGPDMLKLQMERDEDGETRVQYTMGAGLESMRRDAGGGMASGNSSFFHYNHLGTTIALTNAAESVSDTYRHDAWGVLLAATGSTPNPHTYVGQQRYYRMPEPDLYHLGARRYAPTRGQFAEFSPRRAAPAAYVYVGNRPNTLAAPLGLPVQLTEPTGGVGRLRELERWLNDNPRLGNQCDPARVDRIREFLLLLVKGGRSLHFRIAPGLLEAWLEGSGQPDWLTYGDLMADPYFAEAHRAMKEHARGLACSGSADSHNVTAGEFALWMLDLYNAFHLWGSFTADATYLSDSKPCTTGEGKSGHLVWVTTTFTYRDKYDWQGEVTKLPRIDVRFNQAWGRELAECWHRMHPKDLAPRDVNIVLQAKTTDIVCCPCE